MERKKGISGWRNAGFGEDSLMNHRGPGRRFRQKKKTSGTNWMLACVVWARKGVETQALKLVALNCYSKDPCRCLSWEVLRDVSQTSCPGATQTGLSDVNTQRAGPAGSLLFLCFVLGATPLGGVVVCLAESWRKRSACAQPPPPQLVPWPDSKAQKGHAVFSLLYGPQKL
ncbi:hypothetical protein R6Z07M_011129 [Ovis aries]